MEITYQCSVCAKRGLGKVYPMICECGGDIKGEGMPSITGTRDGFGIGQNFIDERTNREITTWREWERAGYREPNPKNQVVKEAMKEKKRQLIGQSLRQPRPHELPE